jgi:adenosylcobinamide-GDP ribazoletransferase
MWLELVKSFCASVLFYTTLPVFLTGSLENLNFQRIARFAPLVGLLLGVMLGGIDRGLILLHVSLLTRSALLVVSWIGLTGGLHLDGAMDTADGLAVTDPQRRLAVMTDSRTGAFGVMAALSIVLLKFSALVDGSAEGIAEEVAVDRLFLLMTAAAWGRWAQVLAIARYPYLKPTGKGAFHKLHFRNPWDWLLGFAILLGLAGIQIALTPDQGLRILGQVLGNAAIAWGTGAWFHRQFGGHTGDTYGAVVEWTEALILCWATAFKIVV